MARAVMLALFLALTLAAGASPVTRDFTQADLVYVIKILAREMGVGVYLAPGIEGEITVSLRHAPPEPTLALLLADQGLDYRALDNGDGGTTLLVADPDRLPTYPDDLFVDSWATTGCFDTTILRQEVLLDRWPDRAELQARFPSVEFQDHPTLKGFYICGPREDVKRLKAELEAYQTRP